MEKDLFSKVATQILRDKAYKQMIELQPEIQIQLTPKTIDLFQARELRKNELVLTRKNLPAEPLKHKEVIASVIIGPDRYFIKSRLYADDRYYYLELTDKLFKLQRRKNFRLAIPENWQSRFSITKIADWEFNFNFPLHDISTGGFSFDYPPAEKPNIKIGDLLVGKLEIPQKLDLNTKAFVRHEREIGKIIRVGMQFETLNSKSESDIQVLLMELHRVFFSRIQ